MRKLINVASSIALLVIALSFLDWGTILEAFGKLDALTLLAALMICTLQYIFLGGRWYCLVKDISSLSFYQHTWRYFIATFANTFTPANIGGDIYRVMTLRSHVEKTSELVILLVRERVIGLLSFLIVYLICFFLSLGFGDESHTQAIFYYFGVLSIAGVIAGLLSPAIAHSVLRLKVFLRFKKIKSIADQLQSTSIFYSAKEFMILMTLSFGAFLLWIVPMQIIADQMGLNLTLYQVGMMAAMVELIRLVPVTVQGIGLREGAFAYFITLFGQQSEAGFALGTIIYIILSISIILSGIIGWGLSHMSAETADS